MQHYVVNKLDSARVVLLNGSVSLEPKGSKGDTRRIPSWARSHPDVLSLEKRGKIEVLDENEYRSRLGKPALEEESSDDVEVVTPEPEPEEDPEPVVEEEPGEEEAEEEAEDVEEGESEVEPFDDLLTLSDFKALNKQPQLGYLEELGIYEDEHAEKKDYAEAAYEEFLENRD